MQLLNLVKLALQNNGKIVPLIIDSSLTNGTGLMNPSIFINNDGSILCNIRHVNYTLFHSEGKIFHHVYGPLQYIHAENDLTLTTTNFLCHLNDNLDIERVDKINTTKLDVPPIWNFVGLEDVRLVNWDNKLFGSGVRRDTTIDGVGRIELSEYEILDDSINEISRLRIPAPGQNNSYCEKNWMPILDKPFHYVKWTNPTEVVKVDYLNKTCETIKTETEKKFPDVSDFRGGSQVLSWNGYYIAVIHEVRLFNTELGRKDGRYYHRFILWDKDFNLIKISELFEFLGGHVEFCCGMAFLNGEFLISFGFQDNAAFVLKVPETIVANLLDVPLEDDRTPIPVMGVPIVNGVHWLKKLVDSIDYPINHFVIFNNNGRGHITKELDELSHTYNKYIKNFKVCHLPSNLGCAASWNLIIKSYVTAPYWVICNSDISFYPGTLEKLVNTVLFDSEVGIIHASSNLPIVGSWEAFLIRDFVIQKYGLFDENLYPAYCEDFDYLLRIIADNNNVKRIILENKLIRGDSESYEEGGSQTWKVEINLKNSIDNAHELNKEYMKSKWGNDWRDLTLNKESPFGNNNLPISYTTYDLDFIRQKYMGF